ncbi:MAG: nucleotide exchange factor GrpE [Clostridiales bacterium]|nr:nucleotide exchange factor GrpE [Clostridiales bacterium]
MEEKKEKTTAKTEKASAKEKALVAENESLIKEIETLKAQADEFKDKWMRNVAEFDNYKKRNAKLWGDAFNEGVASVIVKILPVGDNLDWALTIGLDEKTEEGIRGIQRKFKETLESLEVEEINPVGEVFDPNVAEAVMQVEGAEGEEPDTVKQVFQKGYRKKEKIIRYAKVSVVK